MKKFIRHFRRLGSFIFLAIFVSAANAQWAKVNTPLVGSVNCFATIGDNVFAGTRAGGVMVTTNDGTDWTQRNLGLSNSNVSSLAVGSSLLYAGTSFGVFLSTDSGKGWAYASSNMSDIHINYLATSGTSIFAGTSSGIFRSIDTGATWSVQNSGFGKDSNITALGVVGTTIFAGGERFFGTGGNGIFISTNNGIDWNHAGLSGIVVHTFANYDNNIFAATHEGIFLSTDNGKNWEARDTGLTNKIVLTLAFSGTNLFAGTYGGGVYLSTDFGMNWREVNTGLTDLYVGSMAISNSYLIIGSYDSGLVWRRSISEMLAPSSVSDPILHSVSFEQNSPNPFSTSTTMKYQLPNHEHVQITLSNLLGQKMATLLDEDVDAGLHDLMIKANDLPNGIYLVMMNAVGITKLQKIVLQR